jgi:hypothetical protein
MPLRTGDERSSFRRLAGIDEFRALLAAFVLHLSAGTLTKLTVSVVVFERSHSPLLSAIALASDTLPHLVGITFLLSIGDRVRPRRGLVVVSLIQALTVAVVALGRLPVAAILVVVLVSGIANPIGTAIRSAVLPDILGTGAHYLLGRAVLTMTSFVAQALGFAAGGVFVATIGTRAALSSAAAISLIAAAVLGFGLADRPRRAALEGSAVRQTWKTNRQLVRQPAMRGLLLAHLAPLTLAGSAQALFVPFAAQQGSTSVASVFFWAATAGSLTGYLLVGRLAGPALQASLSFPLALLQAVPLIAFAGGPAVAMAVGLCFLSAGGTAYHLGLQRWFVSLVPEGVRAQAFGLVYSGVPAIQGIGLTVAGALASVLSPARVIILFGLTSALSSVALVRYLRPPAIYSGDLCRGQRLRRTR